MSGLNMLAFDLGASGGRAMLGTFDGAGLRLAEIHRFPNDPVRLGRHVHWDFLRLFHEIKQGIAKAALRQGAVISSLAVDTWGVDYGLIDREGRLLGNPYHYRDPRTETIRGAAYRAIPEERLYRMTGNYPWPYNTIFQLLASREQDPETFGRAFQMLFMPDLFNFFLTGEKAAERTVASTSGLLDAGTGGWSEEVLDALALPLPLFAPIREPGGFLGPLQPSIRSELHAGPISVAVTASHDSAAAVAAVPATSENHAFISCGTWSIMGVETDRPIVSIEGQRHSFTNEGSVGGRGRFLKNIMGLWLLQECRRQWAAEGNDYSYQDLQELAGTVSNSESYIDPDDGAFVLPSHMPDAIRTYCRDTGQRMPDTRAEIVRCIVESMALKYRKTLDELGRLAPNRIEVLHLLGGGVNHRLLCQLTANAAGIPVIAGPAEATVIGNLLVQAMAHGEISGLRELRQVVLQSTVPLVYEPRDQAEWVYKYEKYMNVIRK